MPQEIRQPGRTGISAPPTVVVTIAAVADQSTLAAVNPTVSATVDGAPATITAWAWKVNGATTGFADATIAAPAYTPTTAGAKTITCAVTIDGVVYPSTPELFTVGPTALSASVAAISDQVTLDAVTLDGTVSGGVTPYTYSWKVNGATTGIDDNTAVDTTWTPTAAKLGLALLAVTDAAGQVAVATRAFRIGDAEGRVRFRFDFEAEATNDYTTGGATRTIGGVTWDILNQGNLAAGSGTDGTGLRLDVTGTNYIGTSNRGAVGLTVKIADLLTAYGITYDSQIHHLHVIAEWASVAPTAAAVYGVLVANGLPSTSTTHVANMAGENSGGTPQHVMATVKSTTGFAYKSATTGGAYRLCTGLRRVGRGFAGFSSASLVTPLTAPADLGQGSLIMTDNIDVADAFADATDRIGVFVTNAGTGTSSNTLAALDVWAVVPG